MLYIPREKYDSEPRLNRCPFCGRYHSPIVDNDYFNEKYDKGEDRYVSGTFFVTCLDCRYKTDPYESIRGAVEAWNEPPITKSPNYREPKCPFCHEHQYAGIAYCDELGNFIGTTRDPHEDCLHIFLSDPRHFDTGLLQYMVKPIIKKCAQIRPKCARKFSY